MRSSWPVPAVGRIAPLLLPLAACGPQRPAPVPTPAADTAAFVVRMGSDTVAVERFTWTPQRLEGEQVVRDPRTQVRRYTADLRPDGSMSRVTVWLQTTGMQPAGAPYTFTYELTDSVAREEYVREATRETEEVPLRGPTVMLLRYSQGLAQQAVLRARRERGRPVWVLPVDAPAPLTFALASRGAADTVLSLVTPDGPVTARVDRAGRLLRWDGSASSVKVVGERVASADVAALAAEFARRDAAGTGLGALSPRDSAALRVGAATLTLAYGRPSLRGRPLSELAPAGRVWRLGANLTTQISSDRPFELGGAPLPAGTYALYAVPGAEAWTLVVNRRTGVSGREHDPSQDVARVPLRRAAPPATPVERLTMALEPAGDGRATLRIAWATTALEVPVRVP